MINVAVIGTGNMGKHHVRNYSKLEDVKLVAISDINEELGKDIAEKFLCNYYKNYKEMFKKENIDAVSIAVPTKFHKEVALYALNKGKHILLEKPIADTLENGEKIIKRAKEKKIKLMIGHIERFNPAVIKLKEIISEGKLGDVISIIARRVGPEPPQITDVNVIIDLAVHDIDIINYLLNKKPELVISCGTSALNKFSKEDCAEIMLRYGNVSGFIQVNWITPIKIRNLSVTGTKGYAELDYISQELVIHETKRIKEFSNFTDIVEYAKPHKVEIPIKKDEPLALEVRSFIECIKNNSDPVVGGEDGLSVLKIAIESVNNLNKN